MAAKKSKAKAVTSAQFQELIVKHLRSTYGTDEKKANDQAWWKATCSAVNEMIFERLTETQKSNAVNDSRAVHYLSLEFLMGRLTINNLHNVKVFDQAREALKALGKDINEICDEEPDMALGNGGLGRLAACFIDSLATLNYPAVGYGIHYEHGLFRQDIQGGRQIERPDSWREYGNPWEICRPESVQEIPLYGYVETVFGEDGQLRKVWHAGRKIKGVPWDIPVVGYEAQTVNVLRLWESKAADFFDWDVFNAGGYIDSQAEKSQAEAVSKVLYPNDETEAGKELRLIQQYFFCACSLKDIIRRYKRNHSDFSNFSKQAVIQLNDTHPTVAIPELMRILVDEEGLNWDDAWKVCNESFAYTNHTLLPEALEKWGVHLFEKVLPRHIEVIYEINRRFLEDVVEKKWPGNDEMKRRLSIIEEGESRMVRMAYLAVVGSFKTNGVAAMHSELVKEDLFPEFYELWPERFVNVTNGVTPRRWLLACNEQLAKMYDKTVGTDWPLHLDQLKGAAKLADNTKFQKEFMAIKREKKVELADEIEKLCGIKVSPDAMFNILIKRLHEYKRQHLALLHILALYRRLLENPDYDMGPQVFIFGSKAAPGYKLAKDIIYAINKVADKVNNDERIKGKLKVVFMPNYRVTLAEKLFPAGDVSLQISTAGFEASGTGNMKFALNGALTIGTMDGANVEIREEVGDENIFIFGKNCDEVKALKAEGYNPWDYYYANPELKAVLDWLDTDFFTPGKPGELSSIKNSMLDGGDPYLCLADYESFTNQYVNVDAAYRDQAKWAKMAIINSASVGKFNSDRSIEDYVERIWKLEKVLPKQ
ncbi:glycogen/starch/alpha-glucan phosphorylase [Alginatibacterium sediminis]|uniref:Alpha-1,4 glucan phosphorylase n=1 Tax=Alginatibacterium sediminis TaxID=2164068 RepID=A0A420EAZ5_9ALTE|nr:glycogen/starch/alpha-glucan phosphorylase [Alginatibacterium sediminis]RKF17851.1 glycogen/starch/alpha-glucan phosphorylase [Alginatibacterium sediminis]